MKKMALGVAALLLLSLALVGCGGETTADSDKMKVGFIYVGPVGDYGWSNAHDAGKKYVESKLPWLETIIVESVAETDSMRIIDRLVNEEKVKVIFTTSFGYMEDTLKAAEKYPDVIFMHCSGFKQAPNMGTYFGDLYETYYLNGMMAGALTKTNKLGYVGAYPISEVIRHINAFALGAKAVNPKATVSVRWIFDWVNPVKAKEAANALIADGIDSLAFTEDTPAVIEAAAEAFKSGKMVTAFSHYSPMQSYGEDVVVSGQLIDWGILYEKILVDLKNKTWTNQDLWWKMKDGAAVLGGKVGEPINVKFIEPLKAAKMPGSSVTVYDQIMTLNQALLSDTFEPFTGPIKDQKGELKIAEGAKASLQDLITIDYFVDNVLGEVKP